MNTTYLKALRNITAVACLLLAQALFSTANISAAKNTKRAYTKENPLIVGCNWDFAPYQFVSDKDEATGFDIELISIILEKNDIPYKFVVTGWRNLIDGLNNETIDLIITPRSKRLANEFYTTRNAYTYYEIKAAALTDTKSINSYEELADVNGTIALEISSPSLYDFIEENLPDLKTVSCSSNDALAGIRSGAYKYFLWGEIPLKSKIKQLNIENIKLCNTGIPPVELRGFSHDGTLIEIIDAEYTKMEQNGDLEELHNKWFHPERIKNRISPKAIIGILLVLATLIVLMLLANQIMKKNIRKAVVRNADLMNMMSMAVKKGDFIVLQYDIKNNLLTNRQGNILPKEGITFEEFIDRLADEDKGHFTQNSYDMFSKQITSKPIKIKWNSGTKENPNWRHFRGHAALELDDFGRPRYTVNAVKDMTESVGRRYSDDALTQQFWRMFDSSFIAMSFYDKDGKLLDLNRKMKEICGITEDNLEFFRVSRLQDVPIFAKDFDPTSHDVMHCCQHMHYPEMGIDRYLEFRIRPIFDVNDELLYHTVTARDITDERNMYLTQINNEHELQKANDAVTQYENELRYLLEKSDTYVWTFNLITQEITFSRTLSHVDFVKAKNDYLSWMPEEDQKEAEQNMVETIMQGKPFNATHHFNYTPVTPAPSWFVLSGLPSFDEKGNMTGYFGIARDITKLMDTQEKLKQETVRADESGKLKSVFLANMTHEIRTPLNSIVGFADLLQMVESPEDKHEFIRIIRNNCDMLLRLIDDIIEASNMNQGPLYIEITDVDFAQVFNDICQTLAQRVQEPGVAFIVDNPYNSFPTRLDKGRMQQVITNFVTNAVKYTHEGHIKVGYRYENGGIYMYCEDTGAGIPKDKQASVFERFVKLNDFIQGTGLGLSICKSIADRCNGKIGVDSEGEGKGSTFWIWIPCERKENNQA